MKKIKILYLCLGICSIFAFVACTTEDVPDPNTKQEEPKTEEPKVEEPTYPEPEIVNTPAQPIQLTDAQTRALQAANDYAWKLAYALQGDDTKENFLFSPLSASMCMSLLANAAEGETLSEMVAALGNGGAASLDEINDLNSGLSEALLSVDPGSRIGIANSIWTDLSIRSEEIAADFRKAIADYYGGAFFQTDLCSEKGKDEINAWVKDKTFGLIPQFLKGTLSSNLAMVNTVALKAMWNDGFNAESTCDAPFTSGNGKESVVPMMGRAYPAMHVGGDENMQAVELPFGNKAFSMVIVLPTDKGGVNLSKLFSSRSFQQIAGSLKDQRVIIEMPKFKLQTGFIDISKQLKTMGMANVFSYNGKFPKIGSMTGENLGIFQKSILEVDEKGAAAASGTIVTWIGWAGPETTIHVKCDHPFAFVIKENSTGAILFIGVVNKL